VGALGLVQLQGAGDALEDAVGRPGGPAAFQAGVVVDADPGEERDLLAAQPGDPAVAAVILARRETRKSRISFPLSIAPG